MPLDAAGPVADSIATLTRALFIGGTLVFGAVMLLLWLAVARSARPIAPRVWLLGGGVVFPVLLLVPLLIDSVRRAHALTAPAPPSAADRRHRPHVVVGGALLATRPAAPTSSPPTSCTCRSAARCGWRCRAAT